jgi:excisionase family DNA binding protein
MVSVQLEGLTDEIRSIVRDELAQALGSQAAPSGYLNVAGVADFLGTTKAAVRAMVKRHEIPVHRTPNGRLLFERVALDTWVKSAA